MKRWIFTILLFLILVSGGAIVNVAVAWGCAAWRDWPIYDFKTSEAARASAQVGSQDFWYAGYRKRSGIAYAHSSYVHDPEEHLRVRPEGDPTTVIPSWSRIVCPPRSPAHTSC